MTRKQAFWDFFFFCFVRVFYCIFFSHSVTEDGVILHGFRHVEFGDTVWSGFTYTSKWNRAGTVLWHLWLTWLKSLPLSHPQQHIICIQMVGWEWPLIRAVPPACAWHCFRASWLVWCDMVPWCVLTLGLQGELQAATKHFQACCHLLFHLSDVLFASCGHHQFGSLDNKLQNWHLQKALGAGRDGISCLHEVDISFLGL